MWRLCERVAMNSLTYATSTRRSSAGSNAVRPGTDCLHLAVAEEHDCPFVTADERLVRKLGQLPPGTFDGSTRMLSEALRSLR